LVPPTPSEEGRISKIIISSGLLLKGSSKRAKNPGFKTAHTYVQTTISRLKLRLNEKEKKVVRDHI